MAGQWIRALVLTVIVVAVIVIAPSCGGSAGTGSSDSPLPDLPRVGAFEITNDNDDHGNFIELYNVPVPGTGKKVFCVVYSDQMEGGGGAGPSCNWEAFNRR